MSDPSEALTEAERRHIDRVRDKHALWRIAEDRAMADSDDEKACDAADDLLSSIADEWVIALPFFFAALDRLAAIPAREPGEVEIDRALWDAVTQSPGFLVCRGCEHPVSPDFVEECSFCNPLTEVLAAAEDRLTACGNLPLAPVPVEDDTRSEP